MLVTISLTLPVSSSYFRPSLVCFVLPKGRYNGKHHRRTILRQYHPVRTQLPQDRRIRRHPAPHHPARRKADGDTDRSAERDLRKVQGQHIGDLQYDGGNCLFTRLQVGAAIDRRVVYRQRSEARNITQTTDLATGKTWCRGRLFHRV